MFEGLILLQMNDLTCFEMKLSPSERRISKERRYCSACNSRLPAGHQRLRGRPERPSQGRTKERGRPEDAAGRTQPEVMTRAVRICHCAAYGGGGSRAVTRSGRLRPAFPKSLVQAERAFDPLTHRNKRQLGSEPLLENSAPPDGDSGRSLDEGILPLLVSLNLWLFMQRLRLLPCIPVLNGE